MLMIGMLKLCSGFFIGKSIGYYSSKNELSPMLGISLVVVLTLAACVGIDHLFGEL